MADEDAFTQARGCFEEMLGWLEGSESAQLSHADLEDEIVQRGREAQRLAFQDHLDLRALRERRVRVVDAAGVAHSAVEPGHERRLQSVVGEVSVERLAYRHRASPNLHPADAALNLPDQLHSHGLRRLAAIESTRGSFDDASQAIERATGVVVAKRQVEFLSSRGARDVEAFYETRAHTKTEDEDVLVISADGKGIVMRPDSLRAATAKAAKDATKKLETRLSKGEKRNRKRLAEVGCVYDVSPVPRSPGDVLASKAGEDRPPQAPTAKNKWVTASVVDDAAEVVGRLFDEAERRDRMHSRNWVALVDGNNHQIDRIGAEAKARGVHVQIVVDLVHVLEYLWSAAWCFFCEGDTAAEEWVRGRALSVLNGHAREVAAGIRRRATAEGLAKAQRKKADVAARYLVNKAPYLDYPTALASGWPIATGVIEGACRYLVADRMDITGARWSVEGAEAVLKLRAVGANDDFDDYWRFHLDHERQRVHESRYDKEVIPLAA
ncbi:MAG: ISKra4 family transposase [Acidimicrobiales bacterium]